MTTTAHEKIHEDLKAYVDGELRLPRRVLVSRHVANCLDCKKEMEEMKKITHNLFASEGPSTLSDPLRARLLGSIGDTAGASPQRSESIWLRRPTWIYGGAGAFAAVSAVMFAVTYTSTLQNEPRAASASTRMAAAAASTADLTTSQARTVAGHTMIKSEANSALMSRDGTPAAGFAMPVIASAAPSAAMAYQSVSSSPAPLHAALPKPLPVAISALNAGANVRDVDNQAEVGVAVDDVEAAGEKIGDMVKADGGYVATNKLMVEENVRVDYLTVKVPAKDFDSMIAGFARFGTVVSKNVSGEDITDKTGDANTDEQAQIDQVTETEQKLQAERMSERRRAALEEQLTEQRNELAQTRSRLGTLRKTAALSTVNLTLTEKPKRVTLTEPKSTFWSGVGETNHAATLAFQSAIRVPIVLAIWLVALSPIWGPLVLLFRYVARKQGGIDPRDR